MLEQLLVLRCQAGDASAFAELVAQYHPRLTFFLRKLVMDPHAADDALQEVWFDVFQTIHRLNDPAAFPAWVYRIARDRAFRHLRRKGLATKHFESFDDNVLADHAESNGEFTADDVSEVNAALDQLVPEHREVLLLRFVEGMSYDDIARATGSQLGTVRSRLHYAKQALRRVLERNDES